MYDEPEWYRLITRWDKFAPVAGLEFPACFTSTNVNTLLHFGYTPLIRASYLGKVGIVKWLIKECHADVNFALHKNYTPLHAASEVYSVECTRILLENGAKPNCKAGCVKSMNPIEFAIYCGADERCRQLCALHVRFGLRYSYALRCRCKKDCILDLVCQREKCRKTALLFIGLRNKSTILVHAPRDVVRLIAKHIWFYRT